MKHNENQLSPTKEAVMIIKDIGGWGLSKSFSRETLEGMVLFVLCELICLRCVESPGLKTNGHNSVSK